MSDRISNGVMQEIRKDTTGKYTLSVFSPAVAEIAQERALNKPIFDIRVRNRVLPDFGPFATVCWLLTSCRVTIYLCKPAKNQPSPFQENKTRTELLNLPI